LGGNGGNGSGAFGAVGRCELPPELEFFAVELTVDRATARAELELVTPVRLEIVLSTRRDDVLRTTILPLARPALFERSVRRSRSWPAAAAARRDESASPGAGGTSIGVGELMSTAGAGRATGGGKAAGIICTEPALTAEGASVPAEDA